MGSAFFIVLDREDPGFDSMVNGKFLAKESERLEKVATLIGLRSLEEFISYSAEDAQAMLEDLGMDSDSISESGLTETKWYDPEDGLDWVSKMASHVQANPSSVKNSKGVLSDLEEYRSVLEQAKLAGLKWNLQVDF